MPSVHDAAALQWWLPRTQLDGLLELLRQDGHRVIGPTVRDAAVVHADITSSADLPWGYRDEQAPGRYRLARDPEGRTGRAFDFASSPTSWKAFTFPSSVPIGSARHDGQGLEFLPPEASSDRLAFVGVRACDIAALAIHDDVLTGGPYIDTDYATRRAGTLVIAVECASPSGTCFCSSMGTGPAVTSGFDLALTELDEGFVVRAETEAGSALVERLGLRSADAEQLDEAAQVPERARRTMSAGSGVAVDGLHDRLLANIEGPGWEKVAERCLACTNCTMACPTCFCTSVSQTSDLLGHESVSRREWASCFTLGFGRVAGGNFRPRVQDRYRQWLTHKFATWVDQFGTFGCVGCGRCITWCPVGIDVREELARIAPVAERVVHQAPPAPVAATAGRYSLGVVGAVRRETPDTWTLTLGDLPGAVLAGTPGQFLMLDLPGFSAVPISVSRFGTETLELTIRAAGATTRTIASLQPGAQIGLRGPLGRGWPLGEAMGRDVVIVAGGIGLAPLRPLVDACLAGRERFGRVRLFYGARTPADRLFIEELDGWARRDDLDVALTVDRADQGWTGPVGVVTQLFDRERIDPRRTTAFVCGPEMMMSAAARALAAIGLMPERVFLSMERHMECGIGLCGHCQLGRYFVCKDGPVFSRAELGEALDIEGL